MDPLQRFVIMRQGYPVWTTPDLLGVIAFLWGRSLSDAWVVYDYERPVVLDEPDLTAWQGRHWPEETPDEPCDPC